MDKKAGLLKRYAAFLFGSIRMLQPKATTLRLKR